MKCLSVAAKCCIKSDLSLRIFHQVKFNLVPASVLPKIAFSACAPSRLTGLPPYQTAQRGTPPFAGTGTGRILFSRFRDVWSESVILIRLTMPNRKINQERACRHVSYCFAISYHYAGTCIC